MWKHVRGEKALKTYGWAVISGIIFFGSGLVAGAQLGALLVATLIAVALKTPFYWLWEHVFDALWHRDSKKQNRDRMQSTLLSGK